jgi:hypothetical protein
MITYDTKLETVLLVTRSWSYTLHSNGSCLQPRQYVPEVAQIWILWSTDDDELR